MSERFYRDIAPFYDLEFDEFDADVDLYRGYAEIVGSPILELGCGTGRLVVPLAQAGFDVVGIDSSLDMLDRADERLQKAGIENVMLRRLDMRELGGLPDSRFKLVFCAVNSFLHLETQADQMATLHAARRVLDDRGILIIDLFHPAPSTLQSMDDRFTLDGSWMLGDGSRVDRFSHRRVHPSQQLIETTLLFDRVDEHGNVSRSHASYHTRYIHHFEMLALLDGAGFEIEGVYGSYALDAFEDSSQGMIFVAHRR
jgi:ubiquinone/menaquinone biosynthesis C-methylase UbiE